MAAWQGCVAEPSTAWRTATEAAEEAMDIRVGVEVGHAGVGEEAAIRQT
jgi:hypothetical protein